MPRLVATGREDAVPIVGFKKPSSTLDGRLNDTGMMIEGRRLRIGIVEDEAVIAMDIEMMLEDMGVEVVGVAMTARAAIRMAEEHRPDFMTMDINIKGSRDGVSAALEIYQSFGIRSVFVSAYGNAETHERAASANPVGWLQKPVDERALASALKLVLRGL